MNIPQRSVGVAIPPGQLSQGKASPSQVLGFEELKTYGVRYTDEDGNIKTTVFAFMGGRWYVAPNGETYAASLRGLSPDNWLSKLLEDKRRAAVAGPARAPAADVVDVMGEGDASSTAP